MGRKGRREHDDDETITGDAALAERAALAVLPALVPGYQVDTPEGIAKLVMTARAIGAAFAAAAAGDD